ncbi:MAG: aldo/keto reductase [Oscillospiraceae bacterium]|nr:aldo/keto reductase [Oscillospiraceae bacterium]
MQKYIQLKNGSQMPRLGMGAWCLGDNTAKRSEEIEALQAGIDSGLTLIDTAEMYGSGRSEDLIGEAIKDYDRKDLFLVSKVYPYNAEKGKIENSVKSSLKRLGTDYLDMYLLHWRGSIPLSHTVRCMEELVKQGIIRNWGVSNFDTDDMKELMEVPDGQNCAVNQVLYHLGSRGIEYDLLPWHREKDIPIMAYCPIAQAGALRTSLVKAPILNQIADKYNISIVQLLLLFVMRNDNMTAIPRSSKKEHVLENSRVLDLELTDEDMRLINSEFPPPAKKMYLDIV